MKEEEIIEFLKFEKNSLMRWTSISIAWDIIGNRGEISKDIAEEFTEIILSRLESYSWENSGISIVGKIKIYIKRRFLWDLAEYNIKILMTMTIIILVARIWSFCCNTQEIYYL